MGENRTCPVRVFLSLGSNLGEKEKNISRAKELLKKKGIEIIKESSIYLTAPWGKKDQPWFLNQVIEVATSLPPEELLDLIKGIEKELGREKGEKWGPRIIDLDILFYGEKIINLPSLTIPHPYLHERAFVLIPLTEIAPEFVHPVLKRKAKELKEKVAEEEVKKWEEKNVV